MKIAGFDWDEGNITKCQKHGVLIKEIEAVFHANPLVNINKRHQTSEERFSAVDIRRKGNGIFVVFTYREQNKQVLIRPISARYMHQKEKDFYER